jgi:hypothetical protein
VTSRSGACGFSQRGSSTVKRQSFHHVLTGIKVPFVPRYTLPAVNRTVVRRSVYAKHSKNNGDSGDGRSSGAGIGARAGSVPRAAADSRPGHLRVSNDDVAGAQRVSESNADRDHGRRTRANTCRTSRTNACSREGTRRQAARRATGRNGPARCRSRWTDGRWSALNRCSCRPIRGRTATLLDVIQLRRVFLPFFAVLSFGQPAVAPLTHVNSVF